MEPADSPIELAQEKDVEQIDLAEGSEPRLQVRVEERFADPSLTEEFGVCVRRVDDDNSCLFAALG